MAESLNKGIFPEIIPTGPNVCKQQWPHEDHWEMPNLLIGYDDPQYHNHDPDEDVDEKMVPRKSWMGLDIFNQKKKKPVKSPRRNVPNSSQQYRIFSLSK